MKKKKGIRWVTGDIYAVASIGHGEYMKVGEQVSSRIPKQMRELGQKTLSVKLLQMEITAPPQTKLSLFIFPYDSYDILLCILY